MKETANFTFSNKDVIFIKNFIQYILIIYFLPDPSYQFSLMFSLSKTKPRTFLNFQIKTENNNKKKAHTQLFVFANYSWAVWFKPVQVLSILSQTVSSYVSILLCLEEAVCFLESSPTPDSYNISALSFAHIPEFPRDWCDRHSI